jgi:uncharacterized protein with HEPN domain
LTLPITSSEARNWACPRTAGTAFRCYNNTLVHQYQELSLQIMVDVVEHRLRELLDFANAALDAAG